MATYRKCGVCGKKVLEHTECECEIAKKKEYYNKYRKNRTDIKEQKFYRSDSWIRIKDSVKARQLGMDIYEYMTTGLVIQAEMYHHIVEVKDDWNKRLDSDNLIGLTKGNHVYIHSLYNKDEDIRKQTQKILFNMLDKFYKKFDL
ncbi:hypothetical protein CPAST_c34790 [Clostridium pasteurianum DSM 525 = ATCC 6013]|uniref:HNH endonuclease n=1 Tax=Clostridium pasteurianum DSM 525 = ATCC 6013 TaxID=1262449 RepID=A0A0H3JBD5_CLOPA|nr:hypothetical protein [Clostridium pasteurianum]AJA49540.1 hypothetical protein CPAST_c34790 [Clostridium pasteurianum DSM 525 = ATCC 6013]AJA53528.1 hypothetical protein CLPA_c34790 [Clostridium pasteurianum DSM 525 = ATCC 6013]AOZ76698.1 hypothetical protein AQ983_16900 [Clostridium pasteurianum DSM 525 = ATCC 6013]AOZ80495.1 hypothetical protein AQ984_16895 [Clostridium pasteurianum]ELP58942.1 HNH endonuclease domain protein [Clostridium pasteurianum DSM 525 = ATCC 6013]